MTSVVLDASALIALLRNEPGSDVVARSISGSALSAVNYSEVLKKSLERGGDAASTATVIRNLDVEIVPFDEAQAVAAAELYVPTKQHGMSFADRACLALAAESGKKVLTAERKMGLLDVAVTVELIRHGH